MNIGKYDDNGFREDKAENILKQVLISKNQFKCNFSTEDRTPNHDGYFSIVIDSTPYKSFFVQIKSISKVVINAKTGKYHMSFDTKFFNFIDEHITDDNGFFFYVDENRVIYYIYVDQDFLSINRDKIKNKVKSL